MNIKKGEENSKMALLPTDDYVKFVRGSKAAFNALTTKKDDTLYFVYDKDNTDSGSLYIGSRLIGSTGSSTTASIKDLSDVVISTVGNRQILVYDSASSSWKNGSLTDILGVDDKSIVKAAVGTLSLKNFATAEVGSLASKGSDGNLTWITPADLRTTLNVYTKDEINSKLNQSLSRKVVASTSEIDLTASDAESYIYCVSNESGTYDEYIVVNGALEKVGDWTTDLSDYVTKAEVGTLVTTEFNNVVAAKIGDLTNYGGDNLTLVEKITEIENSLKWSEMTE